MPDVEDAILPDLESRVIEMASLGQAFAEGLDPKHIVNDHFRAYDPHFLGDQRVEFMCHCGREKLTKILTLMPIEELKDILKTGPFPLEVRCHHCNTPYQFNKLQIQSICAARMGSGSQRH